MLNKNTKYENALYRTCCQLLRQRCSELKHLYWLTTAADLQIFANSNDPKVIYQLMRAFGDQENHPVKFLALNNKTIIPEKHELYSRGMT